MALMADEILSLGPILLSQSDHSTTIPEFDLNLESYLETVNNPIWIYDCIRKKFVWCNQSALKPWGKSCVEEFTSVDFKDMSTKIILSTRMTLLDLLHTQEVITPWTYYPAGKEPFSTVITNTPISVNHEVMLLCRDITFGKASKLDEISQLTREAFKYCPAMMSLISFDGRVIHQNIEAKKYYDYHIFPLLNDPSKNQEENRSCLQTLFQDDELYSKMIEIVTKGDTFQERIEVPWVSREDVQCWHCVTISVQKHTTSGENVLIVTQIDVSEMKKMDTRLREMYVSQREAQKDRLVQSVSHELRTPLVGILGLSEELLENEDIKKIQSPSVQKSLGMMRSSGLRLINLVERLLELSKLHKKFVLTWKRVDLFQIAQNVCKQHISSCKAELKLINCIPQEKFPTFFADPDCLYRIIDSLVENAFKFTEKGEIRVSAQALIKENVGNILIKVQDTGIGISQSNQERIFDLFEQVDNSTTREYAGSGIGLNMAKRLVEHHGGSVIVSSEKSNGSTFLFSIPYRHDLEEEIAKHGEYREIRKSDEHGVSSKCEPMGDDTNSVDSFRIKRTKGSVSERNTSSESAPGNQLISRCLPEEKQRSVQQRRIFEKCEKAGSEYNNDSFNTDSQDLEICPGEEVGDTEDNSKKKRIPCGIRIDGSCSATGKSLEEDYLSMNWSGDQYRFINKLFSVVIRLSKRSEEGQSARNKVAQYRVLVASLRKKLRTYEMRHTHPYGCVREACKNNNSNQRKISMHLENKSPTNLLNENKALKKQIFRLQERCFQLALPH